MTDRSKNESGAALLGVMVMVFLVAMMANLALLRSTTLARDTRLDRQQLQAQYAAEGGLAKARIMLASDANWSGARVRIGACEVEIIVRKTVAKDRDVEVIARQTTAGFSVVVRRRTVVTT